MRTIGLILILKVPDARAETDLSSGGAGCGSVITFSILDPKAVVTGPDKIKDSDSPFESCVGRGCGRSLDEISVLGRDPLAAPQSFEEVEPADVALIAERIRGGIHARI